MEDILRRCRDKRLYDSNLWLNCPKLTAESTHVREKPLANFFNLVLCQVKQADDAVEYREWTAESSTTPLKGGDASRKPDLICMLPGRSLDWRHLATFGEVKNHDGSDTEKASYIEVAGKMGCLLYAQDGRHSAPCIRILGSQIFLTLFDHGGSLSTCGFDIHNSPIDFLCILIGVSMTSLVTLGFDETVKWLSSDRNGKPGVKQLSIEVDGLSYNIEITELIFLSDTLHGRGTTVWGGRLALTSGLGYEAARKRKRRQKRERKNGKCLGEAEGTGTENEENMQSLHAGSREPVEVVVKDSWIDPLRKYTEGIILVMLNDKRVGGIPTLVHEQQVKGPHPSLQSQDAKLNQSMHTIRSLLGPIDKFYYLCVMSRLVTWPIGLPITDFSCCAELLVAFLDYVITHKDAIEKAGILHRDISLLNILLTFRQGHADRDDFGQRGLLADWGYAVPISEFEQPYSCQPDGVCESACSPPSSPLSDPPTSPIPPSQPDEASHDCVPAMSNGDHTIRLVATSTLTAEDEIVLSMGCAISDSQADVDSRPTIDANPLYHTGTWSWMLAELVLAGPPAAPCTSGNHFNPPLRLIIFEPYCTYQTNFPWAIPTWAVPK
ncbi:hypothetical protein BU15DRAFT_83115 [Melanogaster broomeanus]|nr:hypothetical protein BU15DRAFT_83115 [Melanogaster broomeanus]